MTSWFSSTQAGGAPTAPKAAQARSTTPRMSVRLPGCVEEREVEHEVELVGADEAGELVLVLERDLGDEGPLAVVPAGQLAPAPVETVQLRLLERRVPVGERRRVLGLDHVVQVLRLEERLRDVDPEAVDAAVEPEAQDLLERLRHGVDVPVEVGLLGGEEVEVPLAARLVARPRRPAEDRRPAVRRAAVAAGTEDIARPIRMVGAREGVHEPRVLARGVVRDDVDEHLEAERVRVGEERVEVGERAVLRIDVHVVRDVVAVVGPRRGIERGQPEAVDAQVAEVREPRADARQVADPVTVGVGEAPHVDLIDDGVAPPRSLGHQSISFWVMARIATRQTTRPKTTR